MTRLDVQLPTTRSAAIVRLSRLTEPSQQLSISSHPQDSAGRDRLEDFVRSVFHQAYGARINSFYPHLLSISRPDDSFAAVAGLRRAEGARLFAEQYLDRPIEALLSGFGAIVARDGIAEVGNLAPASAGQARWLIMALTAYLHAAGFSWVVFTAVPALHNAFQRLGLPLTSLATADKGRLDPKSSDDWGHYYEANPQVYAGYVRSAYHTLNRLIDPHMGHLHELWCEAKREGETFRRQHEDDSCTIALA